ncbi:hypothetical protein [Paenibacillus sp. TH7-28]
MSHYSCDGQSIPFDAFLRKMLNDPTVAELTDFVASYVKIIQLANLPMQLALGVAAVELRFAAQLFEQTLVKVPRRKLGVRQVQHLVCRRVENLGKPANRCRLAGSAVAGDDGKPLPLGGVREAAERLLEDDRILSNPADKVIRPKKDPFHGSSYTADEVNQLLGNVKGTKIELAIILGAFYGLRRSEVIGLKWSAIDLINKTTMNEVIKI